MPTIDHQRARLGLPPLPGCDVSARAEATRAVLTRALHAAQAAAILDALEVLIQCPHALTVTRDAYGVAVVRSEATGEAWRGSSVRDALAQFVQSKAV